MHSGSLSPQRREPMAEAALAIGFLALAGAVFLAHRSPTTGYEASLYTGTPSSFWGTVGVALAICLFVAAFATTVFARRLAAVLGIGSGLAIGALPVLRGYYFFGYGDALTHLGWARDITAGELSPLDLFYPGLHTVSDLVHGALGIPLAQSMLLVVLSILTVFLVFVPLCVRELTDRPGGLVVGTFAALLVLPVNHVAFHYMNPHPISEAILLSPLVLYLLVRYLQGSVGPTYLGVSAIGGLLGLALVATVLYHSMQATNLLAAFTSIAILQLVVRRYRRDGSAGRNLLVGHTIFLAVVFVVWNLRFTVVRATVAATVRSIVGLFAGESEAGAVVASRSSSLSGLGAGLPEIFAKLFVPSAIFAVLTAWLVLRSFRRWDDESLTDVRLLGAGLVGVILFTVPFVAGTVSKLVFRNLGFVMVFGTILGAVALVELLGPTGIADLRVGRRSVLVVFFAVLLVVSMVVLFPSPYIYQPNGEVTDAEYQGYQQAFTYRDPTVAFAGVRTGPQRMIQAIYGRNDVPDDLSTFGFYRRSGYVSGANLTRLPSAVSAPRYLVVTDHDRARELTAYRGLRYSRSEFDAVDGQIGVGRVLSDGTFRLYFVRPRGR